MWGHLLFLTSTASDSAREVVEGVTSSFDFTVLSDTATDLVTKAMPAILIIVSLMFGLDMFKKVVRKVK